MGHQLTLLQEETAVPAPCATSRVKVGTGWLPRSKRVHLLQSEMEQVSLPGADEFHAEREAIHALREAKSCPSLRDEQGNHRCPFVQCRHHLWEISNGHGFIGKTDEEIVEELDSMRLHCIHDALRELESGEIRGGVVAFDVIGGLLRFTAETARVIAETAIEQLGDDWEIYQLRNE